MIPLRRQGRVFKPGYIGGKAAAGVFHRIIGEMPPHSVYLEPFLGSGAVFWNKRPAQSSILIDRNPEVIARVGDCACVIASCGDALEIVPTLTLPADAVAYIDPPYPLGTRKGRSYYAHEMTDADHERLLAMVLKLPCRVLISSYPNALYLEALRDWRCCRFAGATRGGPKTEMLWSNFPEPTELHDWRYAGRSFRERLTFTRLAKRTLARLQRMAPRKRGYVLDAIGDFTAGITSGDACRQSTPKVTLADPRANSGVERSIVPNLLLSLFPGIDLLGRGFEAEGFNVVRGPDTLLGQDVREYRPARHTFEGIIGGPPCQKFSTINRNRDVEQGMELVGEFIRCVVEAQPVWFVMENVPGVPDIEVPGYRVQRFNLNALECGLKQNRIRVFQFGSRDRSVLVIHRSKSADVESHPACLASEAYRDDARSWEDFCELQGLPRDFTLPGWSKGAKYRAVGNGVPIPMARVIARAIHFRKVTGTVRLCICECGREVPAGRTMATAACRKRMQRRRDAAGVTGPGVVTPAQSQAELVL